MFCRNSNCCKLTNQISSVAFKLVERGGMFRLQLFPYVLETVSWCWLGQRLKIIERSITIMASRPERWNILVPNVIWPCLACKEPTNHLGCYNFSSFDSNTLNRFYVRFSCEHDEQIKLRYVYTFVKII